jgi:hypothetical protein
VNRVDLRLIFLVYVAIKYAAYTAWCYAGLRWLMQRNSFRAGMGFGFARLLLGVFFGVGIFIVGGRSRSSCADVFLNLRACPLRRMDDSPALIARPEPAAVAFWLAATTSLDFRRHCDFPSRRPAAHPYLI